MADKIDIILTIYMILYYLQHLLPLDFLVCLHHNITYSILNTTPETFTKTVDKAFADMGIF